MKSKKFKVIHFITSLGLGGAELVLFKLLQNKNKFIEHEVICLNSGGVLKKKIEKLKIKVKCLSLEKNFIKNSFACYKYLNTIKKNRIIVQTWLPHADLYGSLVCKLAGLNKIIWNIRISNITFKSFKISTIFIIFINSLISRLIPAKIISCSKAGIDFHTKIGYKKNLFKLIPNGFDPAKKSIRSNKYSKYFTVGMFSRYHKVKNHQYLFNSIKILQKKNLKFKILLLGPNISKQNLDLIKDIKKYELEKNVIFVEKSNILNVNKYFSYIDLYTLCSRTEGFPNILAEAVNNGVSVLSTNVGDSELIVPSSKCLIPLADAKYFGKKIYQNFMQNKNKMIKHKKLKNYQVEFNNKFSLKKMIFNYEKTWKKIL